MTVTPTPARHLVAGTRIRLDDGVREVCATFHIGGRAVFNLDDGTVLEVPLDDSVQVVRQPSAVIP